jgi:beta-glucosidase
VYQTLDLQAGTRYPIQIEARGAPLFDIQLLWKRVADSNSPELRKAAVNADVIVAVVGLTSDLEGEESKVDLPGFSGGDRTNLELPVEQQHLLEEAESTGKPLVVVLMNGSSIDLSWAKQHVAGIVEAWYPGQAGGSAVGRILSGQVNPSGRLPLTFYKEVAELPPFDDYSMRNRTYRYYTGVPVFPFGYGLSYTQFVYSDVRISPQQPPGDTVLHVTAQVRNTGSRAGDDVAQLYLRFPKAPGTPLIALRGFQRVSLQAGAQKTVRFTLSRRDLSSVSAEGIRRIAAGQHLIIVGGGMPGSGLSTSETSYSSPESEALPF